MNRYSFCSTFSNSILEVDHEGIIQKNKIKNAF